MRWTYTCKASACTPGSYICASTCSGTSHSLSHHIRHQPPTPLLLSRISFSHFAAFESAAWRASFVVYMVYNAVQKPPRAYLRQLVTTFTAGLYRFHPTHKIKLYVWCRYRLLVDQRTPSRNLRKLNHKYDPYYHCFVVWCPAGMMQRPI